MLCDDAKKILDMPNAGGSSILSEALSMQILHDQYHATGVRTEMEIEYWSDWWKRCDYLTKINGENVAVSVTRVAYAPGKEFTEEMAIQLFEKKLYGLVVARAGLITETDESFFKSILHILCRSEKEVQILRTIYDRLSMELRSDIEVIITVVTGRTDLIFTNRKY